MKRFLLAVFIVFVGWAIRDALGQTKPANEQTKQIQSSKDVTLIEDPKGLLANSEGPTIFVGRTGQPVNPGEPDITKRRGLVAFDFTGVIPPRSKIVSVLLTMNADFAANQQEPSTIYLHRVTKSWKEGPTISQGGRGDVAKPGDPTWTHSIYPTRPWSHPGGDYVAASSAETVVVGPNLYAWNSTPKLVADVQLWVNSPKRNFGWILIGDESHPQTAKRFQSSENTESGVVHPQLTVVFIPPKK